MLSPAFLDNLWYGNHPASIIIAPLGWIYSFLIRLRRIGYRIGLIPTRRADVPVIIAGNITVGGTGKTPLVIWLAQYLKQQGYHPGIVSRGYGGAAVHWPQQVRPDSDPYMVGDEPVIIARRTGCPVAASPDRYSAVEGLLQHSQCDILICDDGLQHLSLARDIEIAVVDGIRRFGNGRCLPAGPLREPVSRLQSVDMVVTNGTPDRGEYAMEIVPGSLHAVTGTNVLPLSAFAGQTVHAIAGIGYPARFFDLLRTCNMRLIEHPFPDHYAFTAADIIFDDDLPVIMTEKDAIKCTAFATTSHWYLTIDAGMDEIFQHRFNKLLKDITDGQKAA